MDSEIIQNAVKILEPKKFLVSTHIHDFVAHEFTDGNMVAVDGGNNYLRRVYGTKEKWIDWSLSSKDSLKVVASKLLWGTYGKSGDEPLHYIPLINCETLHLKAILKTQKNIAPLYKKVIKYILKQRKS